MSTTLIPASSAWWIIRTDPCGSALPHAPNIMAPSAYSLTEIPVPPRILRFMRAIPSVYVVHAVAHAVVMTTLPRMCFPAKSATACTALSKA